VVVLDGVGHLVIFDPGGGADRGEAVLRGVRVGAREADHRVRLVLVLPHGHAVAGAEPGVQVLFGVDAFEAGLLQQVGDDVIGGVVVEVVEFAEVLEELGRLVERRVEVDLHVHRRGGGEGLGRVGAVDQDELEEDDRADGGEEDHGEDRGDGDLRAAPAAGSARGHRGRDVGARRQVRRLAARAGRRSLLDVGLRLVTGLLIGLGLRLIGLGRRLRLVLRRRLADITGVRLGVGIARHPSTLRRSCNSRIPRMCQLRR
jgi:hypothetical protein